MIKWSEKAIKAAIDCWYPGGDWEADVGVTINADIKKITLDALNAAVKAQEEETKQLMNERLRKKIEELECRKD